MERAHRRARSRARSLVYGRRRAARRVAAGGFVPHPGWRHRIPAGRVVLQVQGDALARVAELVDAEALWRADRRATVTAVLRGLVFAMSWELGPRRGLVAGVTHAQLAEAAGCSVRTVSRVVAWAIETGLVVCVEAGATAAFLGTESNRAPSYVLTVPEGWEPRGPHDVSELASLSRVVDVDCGVVDGVGDPPASCVEERSPRRDRGQSDHKRHDQGGSSAQSAGHLGPVLAPGWGWRDRAETPAQRAAAADTLLERLGIGCRGAGPDGPGGAGVVRWRARALLGPWLAAGWSVAELLHAAGHDPDDPARRLGDVARGARSPLAVLAGRLRPWVGRRDALPASLSAVDGADRRRRAERLAEADPLPAREHVPTSTSWARAAARAHLDQATEHRDRQRRLRGQRRGPGGSRPGRTR